MMMMMMTGLRFDIVALAIIFCVAACSAQVCPPPGYGPDKSLDAAEFLASAPFYVQQQTPLSYTPRPGLQCVSANYVPIDPTNLLKGFYVRNYLNIGQPNGWPVGTSGSGGITAPLQNLVFQQRGNVTDVPGAFAVSVYFPLVGPVLDLINFSALTASPLWVVAFERNATTKIIEWAILTGGPPTVPLHGACAMVPDGLIREYLNGAGYWLFTHDPIVPDSLILKMREKGASLGLDNSQLQIVKQQGCNYSGRN